MVNSTLKWPGETTQDFLGSKAEGTSSEQSENFEVNGYQKSIETSGSLISLHANGCLKTKQKLKMVCCLHVCIVQLYITFSDEY